MEELKKIAGVTAAKYVEDGMVVGLGTGSTAYFFVEEIGRRIKEEGLSIVGVTTSSQTTKQAEGLGIPLKAVDDIDSIDVTVDGADEVDPQLNGIKGGGGTVFKGVSRGIFPRPSLAIFGTFNPTDLEI
jgi:ribose 5-phosphate isomerase A